MLALFFKELFGKGTRPKCAEIISETENNEHVLFKEHFYDWTDNKWILSGIYYLI